MLVGVVIIRCVRRNASLDAIIAPLRFEQMLLARAGG